MPSAFAPSIVAQALGTTRESAVATDLNNHQADMRNPDEGNALFMSTVEVTRDKAAFLKRIPPRKDYEVLPGGRTVYAPGKAPNTAPYTHVPPRFSFGGYPTDPLFAARRTK